MTVLLVIIGLVPLFIARGLGTGDAVILPLGLYATVTIADFLTGLPARADSRRHEPMPFIGAVFGLFLLVSWLWAMWAATSA